MTTKVKILCEYFVKQNTFAINVVCWGRHVIFRWCGHNTFFKHILKCLLETCKHRLHKMLFLHLYFDVVKLSFQLSTST